MHRRQQIVLIAALALALFVPNSGQADVVTINFGATTHSGLVGGAVWHPEVAPVDTVTGSLILLECQRGAVCSEPVPRASGLRASPY